MSTYSSRPVANDEKIARFIFSPVHFTRKGDLKPSLFSHTETKGCSVQRDSIASDAEFVAFLQEFLKRDPKYIWMGVASARCDTIREQTLADGKSVGQAFCVYDTAEKHNTAHAEICETRNIHEADAAELRRQLFSAFGDGKFADRQTFRGGAVWNALPAELQARIPTK